MFRGFVDLFDCGKYRMKWSFLWVVGICGLKSPFGVDRGMKLIDQSADSFLKHELLLRLFFVGSNSKKGVQYVSMIFFGR